MAGKEFVRIPGVDSIFGRMGGTSRGMPLEDIDRWDQLIRRDLADRCNLHNRWALGEALVRNTKIGTVTGRRRGNLVENFLRLVRARLFTNPWHVAVDPYDPDFREDADKATIAGQCVWKIVNGDLQVRRALTDSLWANHGWIEVSHPLDNYNLDLSRTFKAYNRDISSQTSSSRAENDLVPVSPEEVSAMGYNPEDISEMDPTAPWSGLDNGIHEEPESAVFADNGFPLAQRVSPYLVWTSTNTEDEESMDYVARLRFMSPEQLRLLQFDSMKEDKVIKSSAGYMKDLGFIYERTSRIPLDRLKDGVIPVVTVYIKTDFENPRYDNWMLCFVIGRPDRVIYNRANPYGFVPVQLVRPFEHKGIYDDAISDELAHYADSMDLMLQALFRRVRRAKTTKVFVGPGAGLAPKDAANYRDDDYEGEIPAQDPSQIKIVREDEVSESLLRMVGFIRSLAGASTGISATDQAQTERYVTAQQTQGVQVAQGIIVESIKNPLVDSAASLLKKLMCMLGMYSHQGVGRKYAFGGKTVTYDAGKMDMTNSFTYNVHLTDTGAANSEVVLLLTQFMKLILSDGQGVVRQHLDVEEVVERYVRAIGLDKGTLAKFGGQKGPGETYTPPPETQVEPMGAANPGTPAGGGASFVNGEHPERLAGSQGVTRTSNSMEGMRR